MKCLIALLALATAPLFAAPPANPGPQLCAGKNDAEWQPLFSALGKRQAVQAEFVENRWFPFRKVPVVLKGVMRLAPGAGMSLGYTEPEKRVIVIDERGLLLRDEGGHQREFSSEAGASAASSAMLPILKFDWVKLDQVFFVYAAREGEEWRIDFVPRDADLASKLGRIVAEGKGVTMSRLEFRRSAMQRVEILIGETKLGADFTAEERKAYFR